MNRIVQEFFRGLKERDELDAILPEMLTAMGFEVLSRPMTGTRQYGADIAALGDDVDGTRKLFLFSVKRGDLNRTEWNGASDQALRPSLDEIKDAYLNSVAPEHAGLPVVVVIAIGGLILENVQPLVNGYMRTQRTATIEYRVWSGDTLTGKVMDGALREEVFPAELRHFLRKASAMVEEPDVALEYFRRLVRRVAANTAQPPVARVRILYLALWILFVWGREAKNLEAPYRASELVVLTGWELLWGEIDTDTGRRLEASHSFFELVQLHLHVWESLYAIKVLPHAASIHALSFAAGGPETIDINIALFETAGRIAMGGLWKLWAAAVSGDTPRLLASPPPDVEAIATQFAEMPFANPAMFVPVTDGQAIDLSLSLLFLGCVPSTRSLATTWVQQTAGATMLAYKQHLRYPATDGNYTTLIRHPLARTPEYREDATKGSILYPLLAMVAHGLRDDHTVQALSVFQTEHLAHCNLQTWVPNSRTEDKIWHGDRYQGASLGGLSIGDDGEALIAKLRAECAANVDFTALSAVRLNHWPVLLLACRHYRLPPPPQIWLPLLDDLRAEPERYVMEATPGRYGKARYRVIILASASRLEPAINIGKLVVT
jgi:hypothetical protein